MPDNPSYSERSSIMAPPSHFKDVTPSDTINMDPPFSKALFIGTGGNISIAGVDLGDPIIHRNVANGTILVGNFKRVNSTNTTASGIVQQY